MIIKKLFEQMSKDEPIVGGNQKSNDKRWIHKYKGFNIVKTGTKEYPYNIYKDDGHGFGTNVGYGGTIKDCKADIDAGLLEESVDRNKALKQIINIAKEIANTGNFGRMSEMDRLADEYDIFVQIDDDQIAVEDDVFYIQESLSNKRINMRLKLIESKNGNTFIFHGKPAWCGAVNVMDGIIEEIHTYEEAEGSDFHHSFYFSDSQLDSMEQGESCFFCIDNNEIWLDPTGRFDPEYSDITLDEDFLTRKIKDQIRFINKL